MTNEYRCRDAEWDDIPNVAEVMCPADHAELYAMSGLTPHYALWSGMYNSSKCSVLTLNDRAMLMYGVIPYGRVGSIWMAGANMKDHIRGGYPFYKPELERICHGFRFVTNYMDCRQKVHRKLLERFGFVFCEDDIIIVREVAFQRFIKKVAP